MVDKDLPPLAGMSRDPEAKRVTAEDVAAAIREPPVASVPVAGDGGASLPWLLIVGIGGGVLVVVVVGSMVLMSGRKRP